MKKIILLFALVLLASIITKAQFRNNDFRSFSIKVGAAVPMLDFKNDDSTGAASGFGLSFRYFQPIIKTLGLGVYGEAATFLNATTKTYRDNLKAIYDGASRESGTYSTGYPAYTSIPLSVGLALQYDIGKFSVLADAGFLVGFIVSRNQEYDSRSIEISSSIGTAQSFGFKTSAGLMFNRIVSLSLGYYYMGKPEEVKVIADIKNKLTGVKNNTSGMGKFGEVGLLNVALGIHF